MEKTLAMPIKKIFNPKSTPLSLFELDFVEIVLDDSDLKVDESDYFGLLGEFLFCLK